jgi:hypothetical protein
MRDVKGANCASATPDLRGNFEPPEENSNGLRRREPPLPPSDLSGSKARKAV